MVKLTIKVDGKAVENFSYRDYQQKREVTAETAVKIIKAVEAILDGTPAPPTK